MPPDPRTAVNPRHKNIRPAVIIEIHPGWKPAAPITREIMLSSLLKEPASLIDKQKGRTTGTRTFYYILIAIPIEIRP